MAKAPVIDIQIADESNSKAQFGSSVIDALTIPQYQEAFDVYALLVNNIINGILEKASMTFPISVAGLVGNVLGPNSDVEEIGHFAFATADNRKVEINIPGIDLDTFILGSDDLDQADPDVAAFIAIILNGVSTPGGTIIPTDVAELDVDNLRKARKQTRPTGTRG
ncbi:hypothetical protein LCGC14_2899150 [marine sediment metagenome]|uniref:Uncharacterized protein n=1 Tax=marine sediment metagenome TaxID=412755 RepID=A0A0F8XV11_9ZZZZ